MGTGEQQESPSPGRNRGMILSARASAVSSLKVTATWSEYVGGVYRMPVSPPSNWVSNTACDASAKPLPSNGAGAHWPPLVAAAAAASALSQSALPAEGSGCTPPGPSSPFLGPAAAKRPGVTSSASIRAPSFSYRRFVYWSHAVKRPWAFG